MTHHCALESCHAAATVTLIMNLFGGTAWLYFCLQHAKAWDESDTKRRVIENGLGDADGYRAVRTWVSRENAMIGVRR